MRSRAIYIIFRLSLLLSLYLLHPRPLVLSSSKRISSQNPNARQNSCSRRRASIQRNMMPAALGDNSMATPTIAVVEEHDIREKSTEKKCNEKLRRNRDKTSATHSTLHAQTTA